MRIPRMEQRRRDGGRAANLAVRGCFRLSSLLAGAAIAAALAPRAIAEPVGDFTGDELILVEDAAPAPANPPAPSPRVDPPKIAMLPPAPSIQFATASMLPAANDPAASRSRAAAPSDAAPAASLAPPAVPLRLALAQEGPAQPTQPTQSASPGSPADKANLASDAALAQWIASIQPAQRSSDRLRLVKDKSAVIRLTQPISRASIASPEVADVAVLSPTDLIVSGKQFGTTQLVLFSETGLQKIYDLVVEVNVPLLEELIRDIAPSAQVKTQSLLDTIVLTGSVPDATTAQRIAEIAELLSPGKVRNQLNVAGVQQVQIRCTVAEVNRSAMRELDMNWFFGGAAYSRDFFFANNLNGLNPTIVRSSGLLDLRTGQQFISVLNNANGVGTNLTFGFTRAPFQFFVQALRENGLIRVLAEPNLIAINGQKATFLVGGEVPIPIVLQNTFSVEYKKFGIQLEFTPHVVAGQIIRMTVTPEVSDIDPTRQAVIAGFAIPAFTTRRAESTVEVGNGQTFAMAGLLNQTVRATARKIPGIGDLPVIGTLFSSTQYMKNETELVILVTPELVSPLEPHQVAPVPGQDIRDPNDAELFLFQQLEARGRSTTYDGVPRNTLPVTSHVRPSRWGGSADADVLSGPYGMSFDDEEDR